MDSCLADHSLNSLDNPICVGCIQLIQPINHSRNLRGDPFQIVEHFPSRVVPEGMVDQNQLWGGIGGVIGHLLNPCGGADPMPVTRHNYFQKSCACLVVVQNNNFCHMSPFTFRASPSSCHSRRYRQISRCFQMQQNPGVLMSCCHAFSRSCLVEISQTKAILDGVFTNHFLLPSDFCQTDGSRLLCGGHGLRYGRIADHPNDKYGP